MKSAFNSFYLVVHITADEKVRLPPLDVSKLWYEFAAEAGKDIVYEPHDE